METGEKGNMTVSIRRKDFERVTTLTSSGMLRWIRAYRDTVLEIELEQILHPLFHPLSQEHLIS